MEGKGGRAASTEGQAGGGRGGQARAGGLAARTSGTGRGALYSALPHHGSGRGTAAPRSVARQALPRQRSAFPVVATLAPCHATMAIGVAKSVGFKEKNSV